ncbi:MAG: hypothetical protein KC994_17210, partial [Candidatus Omnitrophica bacterium]|nr:hypothetical protein [Candidatus Omnitrophota bacterium]
SRKARIKGSHDATLACLSQIKERFPQVPTKSGIMLGMGETDEEVIESARYALEQGMPGYGYIFSTSNCVYPGMKLSRYDLIHQVWEREGNYPD